MIILPVKSEFIAKAKEQIKAFEQIEAGSWRYTNVEAWRGIVCEFVVQEWLKDNFIIEVEAKGLDTSGIVDECDVVINGIKIEIKSATKNYFRSLMPKVHDIDTTPKDIYIGAKYNETVEPNEVQIIGFIKLEDIKKYPKRQNKGAPYYDIPLTDLTDINELKNNI